MLDYGDIGPIATNHLKLRIKIHVPQSKIKLCNIGACNRWIESELNFDASFRAKNWTASILEENVGEEGEQYLRIGQTNEFHLFASSSP